MSSSTLLLSLLSASLLLSIHAHHGLFTVTVEPQTFATAGVKHQFVMHLTDEAGRGIPVQDLRVVHEKLMHVMVLSSSWDSFVHVHPEDFPDLQSPADGALGKYHLALEFPHPGSYAIMVEFAVMGSDGGVQIIDIETTVEVLGEDPQQQPSEQQLSASAPPIDANQAFEAVLPLMDRGGEAAAFAVDLSPNNGNPLFAGSCAKLELNFKLSSGGEVTDLVPYLGAASHIAVAHESMEMTTLTHLHGMSASGGEHMMGGHMGGDPCAMDMMDMPPPPGKFGSKVVTYHQFASPGLYVLVAQAQREGGELIHARFVLRVLELPVVLYTNPEGPLQAGEPVELEARLAAESFWGPNPTAALEAIVVSRDLKGIERVKLAVPDGSSPAKGFRGNVTFAAAGTYYVRVQGVLHTDVQPILAAKNFTLQVEGAPAMDGSPAPLEPSPMAKLFGTRQSMVGVLLNGTHEPMSTAEMTAFQATSDGVKVSLDVNGGGIATAKHCISLRIRTAASQSNLHPISVSEGDAGHIIAVRRNPSGELDDLQYAAMYLMDPLNGNVGAEGFGPSMQKDLIRGLCAPMTQPFRATEISGSKVAVAFMTFEHPGEHLVSVSVKTPQGILTNVNFVINVCPETAEPVLWSSSCAWPVQPIADDRVLIPGGKHVILDQSTPMLSELVIHGTLEVAPGGNPKTLNTARILLDNGGSLIAGTDSAPYEGEFSIHFNRGGLAVLGSGALQGSGLLAVADGALSLVGSKADGQDGAPRILRDPVAAGATVVIAALEGITWAKGLKLLLTSAGNSTAPEAVTEVVQVKAYKAATEQLTLAAPLKHSYPAGSALARLQRSIRITTEQYPDGGSRIRLVPSSGKNSTIDGGAVAAAMSSRRSLLWDNKEGEELLHGSTRRLLHADITASLSRAGAVMVAAGGDGTTYFVSNRSMDVTLEAVEFEGMGRTGSRNPVIEMALPDGYCAEEGNPLHRPPSLRIRQNSMHSLHAACVHVDGLSGSVEVTDNLCFRPRGEGILVQGHNVSCQTAPGLLTMAGNMVLETTQGSATADVLMGQARPASGIWLQGLEPADDEASAATVSIDRNVVAASEGHGIGIVRSRVSSFSGNAALHNRLLGLLYGDSASCGAVPHPGGPSDSSSPAAIAVQNVTLAGNGESQACMKIAGLGIIQTQDLQQKLLPTTPSTIPRIKTLDAGLWLEGESIPTTPKSKLLYYQFDVPEDTASVKLMVNQLQGFVDVLVNPFGGAPCHAKFDGCPPQKAPNTNERNNIRGMSQGFSAKQDSKDKMITVPMPNMKAGTWVIAVGCPGCRYDLGINFTQCGDGWMGFKSTELHPSPHLAALESEEAMLDRAGYNFTCVPVIPAQVNTPVLNLTLDGNTASAFIKTEVPEFTSQLWTRVRRVGHSGKPSALHFRTYSGRLPTFSPSTHTTAQTLTSDVDVATPAPDVREAYEIEDAAVPVDHFSMMMMFLEPGTYYTVVTQSVTNEDPGENRTVAQVEVEVGAVSCETGRHVQAENYFFPPHHIEDMVASATDGHVPRACNMAVELVQGLRYMGPQALSTRFHSLAGMTRGGRTTEYLIDVPRYSSSLKIHLSLVQSPGSKVSPTAEVYVRYGVPPVIVDSEDYVQWQFDKYHRMQASQVIEVSWSELYERWGYWYLLIAWGSMDAAGNVTIDVDTGGMPYCPGSTPCSDHGRCWSVDGRGLCVCDAGWGGDDCRMPLEGVTSSQPSLGPSAAAAAGDTAEAPPPGPEESSKAAEGGGPSDAAAAAPPPPAPPSAEMEDLQARIRELETALDNSKSAVVKLTSQLADAQTRNDAEPEDTVPPPPPLPEQQPPQHQPTLANDPSAQGAQDCTGAADAVCTCEDEKAAAADSVAKQAELTEKLDLYQRFGSPADIEKAAQDLEEEHARVTNLTAYSKELEDGLCNGTRAPIRLDGVERDENGNPALAILIGLLTVAAVTVLVWYLCRGSAKKASSYVMIGNGNGADRKSEMVEAGNNWSSSASSSSMPFSSVQHHRRGVV